MRRMWRARQREGALGQFPRDPCSHCHLGWYLTYQEVFPDLCPPVEEVMIQHQTNHDLPLSLEMEGCPLVDEPGKDSQVHHFVLVQS